MKNKIRKFFLSLLGVDFERYENLKGENKKLKNKISDIASELKLQIEEMQLPCKHKAEDINNHYPKDSGLQNIAEAYNKSANTERLVYKQKLRFIQIIVDK